MVTRTTPKNDNGTRGGEGTANRGVESGGTRGTRGSRGTGKEDRDRDQREEKPVEVEVKAGDETSTAVQSEALTVSVKQPRSDRGKSHHAKKPVDNTNNVLLAKMLCGSLSAIAITLTTEPQAAMSESEQQMIVPALAETLQNLSDQAKEQLNRYANPVLVLAGLGLWGLRISQYVPARKTSTKKAVETQSPQTSETVKTEPSRVEGQEGFPPVSLQAVMAGGAG